MPLTSTVSPLSQHPREAVVVQSQSVSAPVLNVNTSAFQRWPQQASPAASTATAAQLVPSFAAHQACAAGPSKSGRPLTPAAQCLSARPPLRWALEFTRLRGVDASRGQGESGAGSRFFSASLQVGSSSLSCPRSLVALACLPASSARQAKPAEIHWHALGRRASSSLRANPSVKGTSRKRAAPYLER